MIIISNGAYKSGSTWLFNILRELTGFPPPPEQYRNPEWVNPSVHPEKLQQFLKEYGSGNESFLSKNHFGTREERDLILGYPNIRIFNIARDLNDVLVSAFYHRIKHHGFEGDFKAYYWAHGRKELLDVIQYHQLWNIKHSQIYISCYENLKMDFEDEVSKICKFLDMNCQEEKIMDIARATSLNSLREKYEDDEKQPFFRKGEIGDWKNYLDKKILKDISRIKSMKKIPPSRADFYTRIKFKLKKIISYDT